MHMRLGGRQQDEKRQPQVASGKAHVGYWGKFLYWKGGQGLEQAAQGGGGVTIHGGVQKMRRCGTLGHGLAGMVALG